MTFHVERWPTGKELQAMTGFPIRSANYSNTKVRRDRSSKGTPSTYKGTRQYKRKGNFAWGKGTHRGTWFLARFHRKNARDRLSAARRDHRISWKDFRSSIFIPFSYFGRRTVPDRERGNKTQNESRRFLLQLLSTFDVYYFAPASE